MCVCVCLFVYACMLFGIALGVYIIASGVSQWCSCVMWVVFVLYWLCMPVHGVFVYACCN